MTVKTNIWNISLATLGAAGVCTLILLSGAQQAQAAPPERDDDPAAVTTPLQDWKRTEATRPVLGPDAGQSAIGVPGIVVPEPPRPNPWWWPAEPGAFNPGSDLPAGNDLGTPVRGQ